MISISAVGMRYAQIVCGPAGSGKSTYCAAVATHARDAGRSVTVVNLDPAAEFFRNHSRISPCQFMKNLITFYAGLSVYVCI